MADQVVMGPQREAGLSYVDSLYWGKGDNVFFAEDSNAPGGYNIAGIYNLATRKTVTIAGAIGDDNVKFNNVANVPAGSIHRRSDQELTGALHPPAPPARTVTESALRRRTHTDPHAAQPPNPPRRLVRRIGLAHLRRGRLHRHVLAPRDVRHADLQAHDPQQPDEGLRRGLHGLRVRAQIRRLEPCPNLAPEPLRLPYSLYASVPPASASGSTTRRK